MTPKDLLRTPGIPKEDGGPVFAAPWEAKAFALVVHLFEKGAFQWKDWVETISAEIAVIEKVDYEPSRDYYVCWVRALETVLTEKNLLDETALQQVMKYTIETWSHPDHVAQTEPVGVSRPFSAD